MEAKLASIGGIHSLDELRISRDVEGSKTIPDFAGGTGKN
jgi:hypothetical protein